MCFKCYKCVVCGSFSSIDSLCRNSSSGVLTVKNYFWISMERKWYVVRKMGQKLINVCICVHCVYIKEFKSAEVWLLQC
jgi:hypothetical protein